MAGWIKDCELIRRLHCRPTVINHIVYSTFFLGFEKGRSTTSPAAKSHTFWRQWWWRGRLRSEVQRAPHASEHFLLLTSNLDLKAGALQMQQLSSDLTGKYYWLLLRTRMVRPLFRHWPVLSYQIELLKCSWFVRVRKQGDKLGQSEKMEEGAWS